MEDLILPLFCLFLFVSAIYYVFIYWWISVPVVLGIFLCWKIFEQHEAEKAVEAKRIEYVAERARLVEQHMDHQEQLAINVRNLIAESANTANELRSLANSIQQHIRHAEDEYANNSFSPFWDAVTLATQKLEEFDPKVCSLISNFVQYEQYSRGLETTCPLFIVDTDRLLDGPRLAKNLQNIILKAQSSSFFATTYFSRERAGWKIPYELLANSLETSIKELFVALRSQNRQRH